MTRQVTPHHHFHRKGLAPQPDADVGVGHRQEPVGYQIGGGFQKVSRCLIQYLSFAGNSAGEHHVEGRNPVSSDHDQLAGKGVHVTYFTFIVPRLTGEIEVSFLNRVHGTVFEFVAADRYKPLQFLQNNGRGTPAPIANTNGTEMTIFLVQYVCERRYNPGTGGPQRVSDGHGSAEDIQFGLWYL